MSSHFKSLQCFNVEFRDDSPGQQASNAGHLFQERFGTGFSLETLELAGPSGSDVFPDNAGQTWTYPGQPFLQLIFTHFKEFENGFFRFQDTLGRLAVSPDSEFISLLHFKEIRNTIQQSDYIFVVHIME
jgi:hypothetical protein